MNEGLWVSDLEVYKSYKSDKVELMDNIYLVLLSFEQNGLQVWLFLAFNLI